MNKSSRKQRLMEIRKEITSIGYDELRELMPIETDKLAKLLYPYAKIEKQIDKLLKRM